MLSTYGKTVLVLLVIILLAIGFFSGMVVASADEGSMHGAGWEDQSWAVVEPRSGYDPLQLDYFAPVLTPDGGTSTYADVEAEFAPLGRFTKARIECCGSMAPFIESDDLLLLLWYPTEIGIGDVIGSTQSECPYTHRVYGTRGDGYLTWGDFYSTPDRCIVEPENVLYKVVGVVKGFYD